MITRCTRASGTPLAPAWVVTNALSSGCCADANCGNSAEMAAKHTENISRFMEMTSMDVGGTRFLNALGTGMLRSPGPGCGQNRAFRGGGEMRGPAIYQQLWPAVLRSGFRICSVEI